MTEAEADAKFSRPRGLERRKLQFNAWRRRRREARFYEVRRAAYEAHATNDIPTFKRCMRKLDRLGGRAWADYLKGRSVDRNAHLASTLRRLGLEPTPGQLRWIEAVLPSSYRS